jgi:enoyl-CoA hydratase
MSDLVLVRRAGDTVEITLNRPGKHNALNLALVEALHGELDTLAGDETLAAVILTGAGEHFVAGADVGELHDRRRAEALAGINSRLFRKVEDLPVPVICAVEGYALGGGCELALAADIRIASESAIFGQPEVGLGIIPGAGATYRLPRVVGMGFAREMILTGRRVQADEALRIGLVNRVVPAGEALAAAWKSAAAVARQGRLAVRLAKLALNAQNTGNAAGQILEGLAQGILFESEDKMQRMREFLDRSGKS